MKRLTAITLQSAFMYSAVLLAVPENIPHILIGLNGNVGQLLLVTIFFKIEMVS